MHSAELCVKYMRLRFGKEADYSEAFLPEIERVLGLLCVSMPGSNPSEDDVDSMCEMFGSYLGETFRRNRGGEWGLSHGEAVTLQCGGGWLSFPFARVHKRLKNGEEDNVHHWYMVLTQYAAKGSASAAPVGSSVPPPLPGTTPPPLPRKKGFFSRLFGG